MVEGLWVRSEAVGGQQEQKQQYADGNQQAPEQHFVKRCEGIQGQEQKPQQEQQQQQKRVEPQQEQQQQEKPQQHQQEQDEQLQHPQEQQQSQRGVHPLITLRTLQLVPPIISALSKFNLSPSEAWVDAISDNIIHLEQHQASNLIPWDNDTTGQHLDHSDARKRIDSERDLSKVVPLLLSLAAAGAPIPSGDRLAEVAVYPRHNYWFPTSAAAATAFSRQQLQGKGLQLLQFLLWLYCSEDVQAVSVPMNYFFLKAPWMQAAVEQAVAEVKDEELLGFLRAYQRRRPAAVAAAVAAAGSKKEGQEVSNLGYDLFFVEKAAAGALKQCLEAKMALWIQQQQQQQGGKQQQEKQKGGQSQHLQLQDYTSLPFAELLEAYLALGHLADLVYGASHEIKGLYTEQLALASRHLSPAAAVQFWRYAVHLQHQGKFGWFGDFLRAGDNQSFHAAAAATEARIAAGEFSLAEAASAILAMQRLAACRLDVDDSRSYDLEPPSGEYDIYWSSRPGFCRAPEMLMVEVWHEVVSSTKPWPQGTPLITALGPAFLALNLSQWATIGDGSFFSICTSITDLGAARNADLAFGRCCVPSLLPLQQVIEGIAGNLACFRANELAETAYGLLLLGCNPATPNASVMAAADIRALVDEAGGEGFTVSSTSSSTSTSTSSNTSSSNTSSSSSGICSQWPVLTLKASPAVAPLLRQIYQQLLLVVGQQLAGSQIAGAAAATSAAIAGGVGATLGGPPPAEANPITSAKGEANAGGPLTARAAAASGVAGNLSAVTGISVSSSSSNSNAARQGNVNQQRQQQGMQRLAPGSAVRAIVVLLGSGVLSPGVEAAEKLAGLTLGGLQEMTWRERAQALHVVEECLRGRDSGGGAAAAAAAAAAAGGGGADPAEGGGDGNGAAADFGGGAAAAVPPTGDGVAAAKPAETKAGEDVGVTEGASTAAAGASTAAVTIAATAGAATAQAGVGAGDREGVDISWASSAAEEKSAASSDAASERSASDTISSSSSSDPSSSSRNSSSSYAGEEGSEAGDGLVESAKVAGAAFVKQALFMERFPVGWRADGVDLDDTADQSTDENLNSEEVGLGENGF
jgi:hypothetical protein